MPELSALKELATKFRWQSSVLVIALSVFTLTSCSALKNAKNELASIDNTPIILGTLLPSIAADGTTAISATLKNPSGELITENNIQVTFSSTCSSNGTAELDTTVVAIDGIATATYLPHGCSGKDTITGSVSMNGQVYQASVDVQVSASNALTAKATLGKVLFFDKNLSSSNQQSCASCHSPANAYFAPDQNAVPLGGVSMTSSGFRSTPTATYSAIIPPFSFLPVTNQQGTVDNIANGKLGTPRRGLMWDGRSSDVKAQASGPFTGPHEMANSSNHDVLIKLLGRPYLNQFKTVYGNVTASSNADTVVNNMADAIAAYESENESFKPFTSKFDAVISGKAQFTSQELNGQILFNVPQKGACKGCHDSTGQSIADPQLFTDLSYRAIGVPRNWKIPYNDDNLVVSALNNLGLSSHLNGSALGAPNHQYYDLGFCGPFRTDSTTDPGLCGAFRVGPLRNISLKHSYFHNGAFSTLREVINFYINRDVTPSLIYKKADGTADIAYNDLPVIYHANIDTGRAPFKRLPSGTRLTSSEIDDLITFLCTLTDGYDPSHPEGYRLPKQCRDAQR